MSSRPEIQLERPALVLSFDCEQIWGFVDLLDDREFSERFPNTPAAYERALRLLCSADVRATWFTVAGLALRESDGPRDARMRGLPQDWTRFIRPGNELTAPLWYRRAFIRQLAAANPKQEIGLHGGLTHLIWTDRHSRPDVLRAEVAAGLAAFRELSIYPRSFSFPRNCEAHHRILPEHGLQSYRGRAPILSEKLGHSLPASLVRALDELGRAAPSPVWPAEKIPGLWNIPSSLFLYPIGRSRARWIPLSTRLERVKRGIESAIRHGAIFHFCLHVANLAESPDGFGLFESILEQFTRARDKGDVEILTMTDIATSMETATERAGSRGSVSGLPEVNIADS